MRFWPRKRESTTYTALSIAAQYARAVGGQSDGLAVAQAGIALISRAMASAEVVNGGSVGSLVSPSFLALSGRSLAIRGNLVALIDDDLLLPAATWEVSGGARPRSWRYSLEINTPSGKPEAVRNMPAAGVVHLRVNEDERAPWKGQSPLMLSSATMDLARHLESVLDMEAQIRPSSVTGVDSDHEQAQVYNAQALLTGLREGGVYISSEPNPLRTMRVGPDFAETQITLRTQVEDSVMMALGVPPGLLSGNAGNAREAIRQFLYGSIGPWAILMEDELRRKLEAPDLRLDFARLGATDLTGRTRACKQLVEAGVDLNEARRLTGLL